MSNELLLITFLLSWLTYLSFMDYFSLTSLAIALRVSSSERKRIFLFVESVQICPCGFVCERKESRC